MNDFFIDIIDDEDADTPYSNDDVWHIAIIDDEPDMHEVTKIALSEVEVLGKPLKFLSAYSAKEGKKLLRENPKIAVVLLDVVMESHDAGLKLAADIRQELNNHSIQIILRTGQPGYAPEDEIIQKFEINDYKTKNELTRSKLLTSISTGVRSYRQINALESSKLGLEEIIEATLNLFSERSIEKFSQAVLKQINSLFLIDAQGMFCVSRQPTTKKLHWQCSEGNGYFVIATTNKYDSFYGDEISENNCDKKQETEQVVLALKKKDHIFTEDLSCFYLSTPSGWEGAIIFDKPVTIDEIDKELLTIFCVNISLGLENAKFYSHLNEAAFKDKLTGLLSRTGLIESIPADIESKNCYLQVVDIDYFRDITENLGYEYGDKVLQAFAQYLQANFNNQALISRLHTDVFALLFISPDNDESLAFKALTNTIKVENDLFRIGTTSGCATYLAKNGRAFDIELL